MRVHAPVWAVAEGGSGRLPELAVSLTAEASRLAGQLGTEADTVVVGNCEDELVRALGSRGATHVFVAGWSAALHDSDAYVPLLTALIRKHRPSVVLCGTTILGRELAARVAACLGTGLASDCTDLEIGPGGVLRMSRTAYGGRASCTVVCPQARPQMATLRPRPFPTDCGASIREPQVIRLEAESITSPRTRVERVVQGDPLTMDLVEADVVVAGGRGVGGREGFELLLELASLLGGAVAASRVAVDAGWVPYHRQVGQSGRTVAPSLYIACGISGAPHHIVGMRGAGTVVSINTDRHAPIVDLADMAVVADLRDVLPPVLARLREDTSRARSAGMSALGMLAESREDR
jgi:electron transfer flavoprotein alpha subunit